MRMWGYPVLPWITFFLVVGLGLLMLWDESARLQVVTVAIAFAALSLLGWVVGKNRTEPDYDDSLTRTEPAAPAN